VHFGPLSAEQAAPVLARPAANGVDLAAWAEANREAIDGRLCREGALLFRGFDLRHADDFRRATRALAAEPLEYRERSSPRTSVADRVYTSTDHPPEHPIALHNEQSYSLDWPLRIHFFCEQAPRERGETPVADCRRVLARLDPALVERFVERKFMLVRNFGGGLALSWQSAFGLDDRAELEAMLRDRQIDFEWRGEQLRTRQVRTAVARHPRSGERTWFNHMAFFHVTSLEPETQAALRASIADEDLPYNTYYGDGAPIEPEVVAAVRDAYDRETVVFRWERGDLLALDNMLWAHGRSSFSGPRKVLVSFAIACGVTETAYP
jgi:alpha-ketoglutarate-dependent taurine dioxygenase